MAQTAKRRPSRKAARTQESDAARNWPPDQNIHAAGWLLDLAAIQDHDRRRFAYRRAAYAVIALGEPVADAVRSGTIAEILVENGEAVQYEQRLMLIKVG